MASAVIPEGADSAEVRFKDGSWLQLERDTTGASRWSFRMFNNTVPDAIGTGTMTALAAATFAAIAETATADGEEVKKKAAPRKRPAKKPAAKKSPAKKPAAKKAAAKK